MLVSMFAYLQITLDTYNKFVDSRQLSGDFKGGTGGFRHPPEVSVLEIGSWPLFCITTHIVIALPTVYTTKVVFY